MAVGRLEDPPELTLLRIVPTLFTATGHEINPVVGQHIEDLLKLPREMGPLIERGLMELVRELRTTNDQHNRIETTEIPDNVKKNIEDITDYFEKIQEAVNTLFGLVGAPEFYPIVGVSYFGGASAAHSIINDDLAWLSANRWKSVRVAGVWDASKGGSVIENTGSLNSAKLDTLKYLIALANTKGMSVDVSMFANNIDTLSSLRTGLTSLAKELAGFRNVFFDVCNEHLGPTGIIGTDDVISLLDAVQEGDAGRSVTCSMSGSVSAIAGRYQDEIDAGATYTFLTPHFERSNDWDTAGVDRANEMAQALADIRSGMRFHMQEETRWGIPNDAVTGLANFQTSIQGARQAGALGWNFHTAAGYDVRATSMESQCNATEISVIEGCIDTFWNDP